MASVYEIVLDPPDLTKPENRDVVVQEAGITIGERPEFMVEARLLGPRAEIEVGKGQKVAVRSRNVDSVDGDRSEWSPTYTFTAADTLSPSAPGVPGVLLVRETPDEPDATVPEPTL